MRMLRRQAAAGGFTLCALVCGALLGCDRLGDGSGDPRMLGAQGAAEAHDADWLASIEAGLSAREYEVSANDHGLQAPNRAHNLRTYFEPDGVRVHDRTAEGGPELVALQLASLGRGAQRTAVGNGEVHESGARVEIRRAGLIEWYENSPRGLEQGFLVEASPAGSGELWLELALEGAKARERGDGLEFLSATGRRLRYADLVAHDARGRVLDARMELEDPSSMRLVVADAGAQYPLTIDPLLTAVADALLLADQASAGLGIGVSGAGDVNGDGYADVIVGAYLYDAGERDEGAAFVFLGSAAGIVGRTPAAAAAQLESDQVFALMGWSVAGAGDVNGDGYGDVIVGARLYDPGETDTDDGAAFVFLGSAEGIADGSPATADAQLRSAQAVAQLGWSVAGAGDVNGDGYADVIVGAPWYDADQTDEGAAFVFLGSAEGIADGTPATAAAQLESDQVGAALGFSVAGAGDVNADGYADAIAGAVYYDAGQTNEGAAFVFLGKPEGIADGTPATADAQLESDQTDACLGRSVSGAGDVNGDGYSDVIVGAYLYTAGQSAEGAAFVFLGGAGGIGDHTPATAATQLESNQAFAYLGYSVAGAGDVNGDGYADVIVGAETYDSGQDNEGGAFVFLGGSAGIADGTPATAVARLQSNKQGANLGYSVAGAGDVNGDGYADVIVGAPYYIPLQYGDEGGAFVFLGGSAGIVDGTPATAAVRIESTQGNARLGWSVAGAGDVNGDGYGDVIVGAPQYDSGQSFEGAAFLFLGSAAGIANGTPLTAATRFESDQGSAVLGSSVAGAGDVNGDGYADVIVGAQGYNGGETDEGAAFVFLGSATGIIGRTPATAHAQLQSDQGFASLGSSAGAGDVNGDGYADVIVGAPGYNGGETDEGAAFVFLGSAAGIVGRTPATAHAQLQSDQGLASLGSSVAGAGDVNGDGYADVIVGAPHYENSILQAGEGAAFVFLGSAAGIIGRTPTTAHARYESNQTGIGSGPELGSSVAGAGDVNGDGYADIIVGAPNYNAFKDDTGVALVYLGSATGLRNGDPTNAHAYLYSDQAYSMLGESVAGAGDVNGDGYADVIVSAPYYDGGTTNGGAAFVFLGSAAGITGSTPATAAAQLESNQIGGGTLPLVEGVAGAGDVNGDGYADVIVGSWAYDTGSIWVEEEGAAFVFLGNAGARGRAVLARQLRPAPDDRLVQPFGSARDADTFRARLRATHPDGRGRVKLQVEACRSGVAFGSPTCRSAVSALWADTGATSGGIDLTLTVPGLAANTVYRWRGRVLYAASSVSAAPIVAPPHPAHGPWRRLGAQSVEADIRTDRDGDLDGVGDATDNCPFYASAIQTDADLDGRGDVCECTDQTGDGLNTVSDLIAINRAIFTPSLATPLCDGDNDGRCAVGDIVAANVEIFSQANTSTCARQPVPGP